MTSEPGRGAASSGWVVGAACLLALVTFIETWMMAKVFHLRYPAVLAAVVAVGVAVAIPLRARRRAAGTSTPDPDQEPPP